MCTSERIQAEVAAAMESGLYSVASLDMFDKLEGLEISENLLLHLDYTQDLLIEFLNELMELNGKKSELLGYLKTIRRADVFDNQSLERENSFLIAFHSELTRETALGRLIKYANEGRQISGKDIFRIHHILLNGTSSEDVDSVRKVNDKFVGKVVDGKRVIDYFPIDYRYITEASVRLANLYNNRLSGGGFDNVLFQPFLLHGLMGALQIFNDGNTRMGRVMQHVLMWQLINERMGFDFAMPPVYATRNYFPYRGMYRDKIATLVRDNNSVAWNDWFDFNLDRIEDNIYASRENLLMLKRKLK